MIQTDRSQAATHQSHSSNLHHLVYLGHETRLFVHDPRQNEQGNFLSNILQADWLA
jgi:hypothetical protein